MLDQFHAIVQAAEMLVVSVGTPHERLAKAFKALRQATLFSNDWPVELWDKYNGICETLLAGGTWQKTIAGMDLETARECGTRLHKAMKSLAVAVEAARRRAMAPRSAACLEPVEEF
jgi:hypothetical protein